MCSFSLPRIPKILPPVVGILGGSFNPAHMGHIHISKEACKRLGIPMVWWMVSPQNPLKSREDMADYPTRLKYAKAFASAYPQIIVTDIEKQLGTYFTIATLTRLKKRYPKTRFIWLMGADNLSTIHHWEKWEQIFENCPILVLDRAPMSHKALRSKAAIRFQNQRIQKDLRELSSAVPPKWGFAHIRKHPEAATNIRKKLGTKAFLMHN